MSITATREKIGYTFPTGYTLGAPRYTKEGFTLGGTKFTFGGKVEQEGKSIVGKLGIITAVVMTALCAAFFITNKESNIKLAETKQALGNCEARVALKHEETPCNCAEKVTKAVEAVTADMSKICQGTIEVFNSHLNCFFEGTLVNLIQKYPAARQGVINALKEEIQ